MPLNAVNLEMLDGNDPERPIFVKFLKIIVGF